MLEIMLAYCERQNDGGSVRFSDIKTNLGAGRVVNLKMNAPEMRKSQVEPMT